MGKTGKPHGFLWIFRSPGPTGTLPDLPNLHSNHRLRSARNSDINVAWPKAPHVGKLMEKPSSQHIPVYT